MKEACGFIVEQGWFFQVIQSENIANDPINSFAISYSKICLLKGSGKLKAIWHSHPPPCQDCLSELDKWMSEKLNVEFVAYDIVNDKFLVHKPVGYEVPYVGRPFVIGIFDCFSLVRDWYFRELNIKIEDIVHPLRDVSGMKLWKMIAKEDKNNYATLINLLKDRGFNEINIKNRKKHDILLINYDKIKSPIHTAIVLDKANILHHPEGDLSCEENYTDYWSKMTVISVRHKEL